jgi:hypothetical protein
MKEAGTRLLLFSYATHTKNIGRIRIGKRIFNANSSISNPFGHPAIYFLVRKISK